MTSGKRPAIEQIASHILGALVDSIPDDAVCTVLTAEFSKGRIAAVASAAVASTLTRGELLPMLQRLVARWNSGDTSVRHVDRSAEGWLPPPDIESLLLHEAVAHVPGMGIALIFGRTPGLFISNMARIGTLALIEDDLLPSMLAVAAAEN